MRNKIFIIPSVLKFLVGRQSLCGDIAGETVFTVRKKTAKNCPLWKVIWRCVAFCSCSRMDLTEVDCKTTRTDPFWDAEPDIGGVRIHHVSNDAGFVNGRG